MQQQVESNWTRVAIFFGLGILVGLALLVAITRLTWHSKFYPGIQIGGVSVSGLTYEQAKGKLTEATKNYQVKLTFNGAEWDVPYGAITYQIDQTLNSAYHYGRRLSITDYLLLLINRKTNFPLILAEGKTDKLEVLINELSGIIEIPPVESTIEVIGKKIEVINGTDGTLVDGEKLDKQIREAYAKMSTAPVEIPTVTAIRQLAESDLQNLKETAEKLITKNLVLTHDDEKIKLAGKELIAFLATDGGPYTLKQSVITEYVEGLRESLNKEPKDAKFEFSEGVVKEFSPGKDGVKINVEKTSEALQKGIEALLSSDKDFDTISIVAERTPPKVTTDKVNELGIRERIGRGESYYAHSIPNRIYNVGLASARANSALIAPGEEFSFNNIVGDISAASGYRSAYVISGGRTVLGDGGGVCQVSTTLFRAAMAAGLPITERWAHAYRVGYYEQNSKPGIDATVYSPSKDLRFKNDTSGHILVQTINNPKALHLVVEIYGTSDGRVATITEPKVWGITPALPTIYQDDPTLPIGATKQVDWAAAGAKTSFEYKVVRNGETIQEKTFTSTFRPWASVYLRGTGI